MSKRKLPAKLFRRLRSDDPNGAGKNHYKGVFMSFRRLSKILTAVALALTFVAVAGGSEAKAEVRSHNSYQNSSYFQRDGYRRREFGRYRWARRRERADFYRRQRFGRPYYGRSYGRPYGRYPYYRRYNRRY